MKYVARPTFPVLAAAVLLAAAAGVCGADRPAKEAPRKVRVLVLEGTPRQRGLTHGREMKEDIHALLKLWKKDLADSYKVDADGFIKDFVAKTKFLEPMRKWTPELVEEIRGIADGAGVPFET